MKKMMTAVAVLVFTTFMISCGGSEKKGAENVDSSAEASQIISYTNDVIDYLNGTGDWMSNNESKMDDMVTFMRTGVKSYYRPMMPNVSFNLKADKLKVTTPPKVMSEEEQVYFKQNMTVYKSSYEAMIADCETLSKYIQNQDYKDDDKVKGKLLADSISSRFNNMQLLKSNLYKRIDVVTEKAEVIILKDSPLREPIFALKAELKNFEELYTVFSNYSDGKATPEEVDALYQKTVASVEANKALHGDIIEANNVKSQYANFYGRCDDALAPYRRALRNVKEKKKVNSGDFNTFNSNYNSLIGAYNNFVK